MYVVFNLVVAVERRSFHTVGGTLREVDQSLFVKEIEVNCTPHTRKVEFAEIVVTKFAVIHS